MPSSAKKFEVENVSKILTKTDNIIYGNIPSFVDQLIDSTGIDSRHVGKRNIDVLKYFETDEPKNPSNLEIDLLNARLLAHVGAWDKIKQHYDRVFANFAGHDDDLHKLKIEYIERIIPIDPNQALNLIEDLDRDNMQPDTKAYILATKSNILRRLKKLSESKFSLDSAVRISDENMVKPYTKHLVNFYKALWIHLNVANKVRNTGGYSKQLMDEITVGEELFRDNISYFEKEGSFDLSESNKNGLALVLLEKGRHLKSAKKDKESAEEFANAIQILEDISQIRARYGYFRGAGQACRNIALVYIENQQYHDALQTLTKSEQFYRYAKPFPQSDVDEVYYRYAEVYEKMGEYAKVFDPVELWIRQKRLDKDWHNEGRGLYIMIKALHGTNSYEKLRQAVIRIIDIYQERLSDDDKKRDFQEKPYAIPNALEIVDTILKINKLDDNLRYKIKTIKERTKELDTQNKIRAT